MRKTLIIIFLTVILFLGAEELDDFRFILGLYNDNNIGLAEVEIRKFIKKYPGSNYQDDADFLLANILLKKGRISEAASTYKELYRGNSDILIRDDILLGLAQSLYELQDYTEASRYLMIFNQEFPSHKQSWKSYHLLGMIALKKGENEKSAEYLTKAIEFNQEAELYRSLIELNLNRNLESRAEEIISEMKEKFPEDDQTNRAILILQDYYLKNEKYIDLLQLEYKVKESSDLYPDFVVNRSIAYYEVENFIAAIRELEEIKIERADYYRALALMKQEENRKARSIFSRLSKEAKANEIKEYSFFYAALLQTDINDTNKMLLDFITQNPNHELLGTAYYYIGLNEYKYENYDSALNNLEKAVTLATDQKIKEKSVYLIAEMKFILKNYQLAYAKFETYLAEYSNGDFVDEALFKIGLINFDQMNYDEAKTRFDRIIKNFPDSEKIGMSNYYLGEINLFEENYQIAKEKYVLALSGKSDTGLIWQRIAEIYYLEGEYSKALEAIDKVPDESSYLYKKQLLKGNVYFAQDQYSAALRDYDQAIQQTDNRDEIKLVKGRKAQTLYNMQRYKEAAVIFGELAQTESEDGTYLIQSANAAFGGSDYTKALELYEEYIEKYPEGKDFNTALTGVADSHYNSGNFNQAVESYKILFRKTNIPRELDNALNGIMWSCSRTDNLDFEQELQELMLSTTNELKKRKLLSQKADQELEQEKWQQALISLSQLADLQDDPKEQRENFLKQASAYHGLGNYQDADLIYQDVIEQASDPLVYKSWAQLKLSQGDVDSAIDKYRKASFQSRNTDLWLQMLKLEAEQEHDKYINDHAKFMEFATGRDKEKARLIKLEWNLKKNLTESFPEQIEELLNSKFKETKAHAQYLKGYELYLKDDFDQAIPELLRVRYLFPEIVDTRIKAEFLACLAYLKNDNRDEALRLFDSIKEELNNEQVSQILQAFDKEN